MENIRILILEDDLKTLSKLLDRLYILEEKLLNLPEKTDLFITILSEYKQVEEYINKNNSIQYGIVLLDRDCKAGGSFHILDIKKIGIDKIIGISSVPEYNKELRELGINKIVDKNYSHLDDFANNVMIIVENLIKKIS